MELVVSVLYYVMTAAIGALLVWNFFKTRDVQRMILYALVLAPFVLRVLRVK